MFLTDTFGGNDINGFIKYYWNLQIQIRPCILVYVTVGMFTRVFMSTSLCLYVLWVCVCVCLCVSVCVCVCAGILGCRLRCLTGSQLGGDRHLTASGWPITANSAVLLEGNLVTSQAKPQHILFSADFTITHLLRYSHSTTRKIMYSCI